MARRTFFSFHHERDIFRVNQIRNSWLTYGSHYEAGYIDAAGWEAVSKGGDRSIKAWIDAGLDETTVTVVLIGTETANRRWVKYEIQQSFLRGNGLLGVYIHNVATVTEPKYEPKGPNPLASLGYTRFKTYDWIGDNGYANFGDWIEEAYKMTHPGPG